MENIKKLASLIIKKSTVLESDLDKLAEAIQDEYNFNLHDRDFRGNSFEFKVKNFNMNLSPEDLNQEGEEFEEPHTSELMAEFANEKGKEIFEKYKDKFPTYLKIKDFGFAGRSGGWFGITFGADLTNYVEYLKVDGVPKSKIKLKLESVEKLLFKIKNEINSILKNYDKEFLKWYKENY